MGMRLVRSYAGSTGVFGRLYDEEGIMIAVTLEHAYEIDGKWVPKIPAGTYPCVRGPHRLASMTSDFITFEITSVPGHTNILYHCGNTEADSEGCVLLGSVLGNGEILESRAAFARFMGSRTGIDVFPLEVVDVQA